MRIQYKEQYLEDLYYYSRTNDKSHRFQPEVVRNYIDCVDILRKEPHLKALLQYRSLHFKALEGDKKGQYSIRVDDKYRISFTVSTEGTQPVTTICEIIKLSNHYD
jgi:proteic killer suppression protein